MTLLLSITRINLLCACASAFAVMFIAAAAPAQRIAVIAPDDAELSVSFAGDLEKALGKKIRLVDPALARSAFDSLGTDTPYNLSVDDSRRAAAAIGCEFLVLVRASVLRRSASDRPEYYDGNAAVFLVSGRSGRLISFDLLRTAAATPHAASVELMGMTGAEAVRLTLAAGIAAEQELRGPGPSPRDGPPQPGTPTARDFRSPVPYRRVKPEYTAEAASYDVRATVDIEIDLSAEGTIEATRIERWAGYGLDESVERTVRGMTWRPAEVKGKAVPMRFLMRYNFKRMERE